MEGAKLINRNFVNQNMLTQISPQNKISQSIRNFKNRTMEISRNNADGGLRHYQTVDSNENKDEIHGRSAKEPIKMDTLQPGKGI